MNHLFFRSPDRTRRNLVGFLFFLTALLFFWFPKEGFAQPTYTCAWDGSICYGTGTESQCPPGISSPTSPGGCLSFTSEETCTETHSCDYYENTYGCAYFPDTTCQPYDNCDPGCLRRDFQCDLSANACLNFTALNCVCPSPTPTPLPSIVTRTCLYDTTCYTQCPPNYVASPTNACDTLNVVTCVGTTYSCYGPGTTPPPDPTSTPEEECYTLTTYSCNFGYTQCPFNPSNCCTSLAYCPAVDNCVPRLGGVCPSEYPAECDNIDYCCLLDIDCELANPFNPPTAAEADIYCDPTTQTKIKTALGCIPVTSGTNFSIWILRLAIPAGGVVAFIVILIASLQLILSAGDPGKIQAAKGLLTAAISGLVLIILSIFILNLIGFKIFKIPGF